jgi:hypothetical protein
MKNVAHADIEGDGDADIHDWAEIQRVFTGP